MSEEEQAKAAIDKLVEEKVAALMQDHVLVPKKSVERFQKGKTDRNYVKIKGKDGKDHLVRRKSLFLEGFGNIFPSKFRPEHIAQARKQYTAKELAELGVTLK